MSELLCSPKDQCFYFSRLLAASLCLQLEYLLSLTLRHRSGQCRVVWAGVDVVVHVNASRRRHEDGGISNYRTTDSSSPLGGGK